MKETEARQMLSTPCVCNLMLQCTSFNQGVAHLEATPIPSTLFLKMEQ